jgi:hypothetical protein
VGCAAGPQAADPPIITVEVKAPGVQETVERVSRSSVTTVPPPSNEKRLDDLVAVPPPPCVTFYVPIPGLPPPRLEALERIREKLIAATGGAGAWTDPARIDIDVQKSALLVRQREILEDIVRRAMERMRRDGFRYPAHQSER